MDLIVYHTTTNATAEKIRAGGLKLNTEKKNRTNKQYSDVFNHFLAQCHKEFLPERMHGLEQIDRDTAIFLSPFSGMFSKVTNIPPAERAGLEDRTFAVRLSDNAPVFDFEVFEQWAYKIKDYFLGSELLIPTISRYGGLPSLYRFCTFIIKGDVTLLASDSIAQKLVDDRNRIVSGTRECVQKYCQTGLLLDEALKHYKKHPFKRGDEDLVVLVTSNDHLVEQGFPRAVYKPEILYQKPIPPEALELLQ